MAGFGHPGRVVVGENHRSSVMGERAFDHFARVDAGLD
jgi:hypothetical protein